MIKLRRLSEPDGEPQQAGVRRAQPALGEHLDLIETAKSGTG